MGVKGKYFFIVSKSTGLVLDIQGGSANAGAQVFLWEKHGRDNQVWYEDPVTGTIRSKLNNLCLDINGSNHLYMNNYQPGDPNQQWRYNKGRNTFENRANPNKVLDVVGNKKDKGAEICSWDFHGRDNQQWKIEPQPTRYFYIKSALNGKVLDVEGGHAGHGKKVIMYSKKDGAHANNQLWFEDSYGNIRSKLDDKYVLDASDGVLRLGEWSEGKQKTFWCVQGNKIVNRYNANEVLDIKGSNNADSAEICAYNFHGGANQQWQIDYV